MNYTAENLVRLARRDGNSIRPYLFVNPIQAKHVPADPMQMLDMCRVLAEKVQSLYPNDTFHVIGLAETATAVAAGVAFHLKNVRTFQTTTREPAKGAEVLHFTESHSHAVEQTLRSAGLAECLREVTRVLIIDDEVTTGNTILKLMDAIRESCRADHLCFSIVSLLNSMTPERHEELKALGIDCIYLARLPHEYHAETILDISEEPDRILTCTGSDIIPKELFISCPADPRYVTQFADYQYAADTFYSSVFDAIFPEHVPCGRILVLGTEECMYPAVVVGEALLRNGLGLSVRVHATTRSPILPSGREGYPLFRRYQLRSMYDDHRRTFVYNLAEYDQVVIVTDAPAGQKGLADLIQALQRKNCRDIVLARWQAQSRKEKS